MTQPNKLTTYLHSYITLIYPLTPLLKTKSVSKQAIIYLSIFPIIYINKIEFCLLHALLRKVKVLHIFTFYTLGKPKYFPGLIIY